MKSACTDPKMGSMLHAYELSCLSEDDASSFETHLLRCDHCFDEVCSFSEVSSMLKEDSEVSETVSEAAGLFDRGTGSSGLWGLLWPKVPVVFRPLAGFVVIAVLLLVGYFMVFTSEHGLAPVQSVWLNDDTLQRSNDVNTISIHSSDYAVINVSLRGQLADDYLQSEYTVWVVSSTSGDVEFYCRNVTFDLNGASQLQLPLDGLSVGAYFLEIRRYDESIGLNPSHRENMELVKTYRFFLTD